MRTVDIEVGKQYLAEVEYFLGRRVTVLEKGLPVKARGYRAKTKAQGVRVRLEESVDYHASGDELIITSSKVGRLWTEEDTQRVKDRAALAERRSKVTVGLQKAGIKLFEYGDDDEALTFMYLGINRVSLTVSALELLLSYVEGVL